MGRDSQGGHNAYTTSTGWGLHEVHHYNNIGYTAKGSKENFSYQEAEPHMQ